MEQASFDFAEFTKDAIRTESKVPTVTVNPAFFIEALRLAVLSSEVLDQVKKHIFYKKQDKDDPTFFHPRPLDVEKTLGLLKELHGVVGYMRTAGLAHEAAHPTTEGLPVNTRLVHAFVGKYTESGELLKALLTAFEAGQPVDKVNLREEMGDDKWYDAIAFDELGADFGDVCRLVITKLRARYPDAFEQALADVRDLDAERKILEAGSQG